MRGDRIITVSEPDCGGKPTIYAAGLEFNVASKDALKVHLHKFFEEVYRLPIKVADFEIDDAAERLAHDKYTWICERFLAEVTELD